MRARKQTKYGKGLIYTQSSVMSPHITIQRCGEALGDEEFVL